MKYVKTNWIDNKTPVNAINLNKIEDAIYKLAAYSLGTNSIIEGNNINVIISDSGNVTVGMKPLFINNVELVGNRSALDLNLIEKEEGKGLSTNDFDDNYKSQLDNLAGKEFYTKEEVDALIEEKLNKLFE